VYFEYAKVRDYWSRLSGGQKKFDFVRSTLGRLVDISKLPAYKEGKECDFNKKLVERKKVSADEVESPGNWGVKSLSKIFEQNDKDFRAACCFKWTFNIKPDIVIETGRGSVVCIEAKLESQEGHYPSQPEEKEEFRRRLNSAGTRSSPYVRQTEVQRFMVEKVLQQEFHGVFITKHGKPPSDYAADSSNSWKSIEWMKVFDEFELESLSAQQRAMYEFDDTNRA
jgi:hypothetical protein